MQVKRKMERGTGLIYDKDKKEMYLLVQATFIDLLM